MLSHEGSPEMGPGKSAFQTGDWQGSTPWPSTVVRQIGHENQHFTETCGEQLYQT